MGVVGLSGGGRGGAQRQGVGADSAARGEAASSASRKSQEDGGRPQVGGKAADLRRQADEHAQRAIDTKAEGAKVLIDIAHVENEKAELLNKAAKGPEEP